MHCASGQQPSSRPTTLTGILSEQSCRLAMLQGTGCSRLHEAMQCCMEEYACCMCLAACSARTMAASIAILQIWSSGVQLSKQSCGVMHEVWVKLGCCTEHFQKPCRSNTCIKSLCRRAVACQSKVGTERSELCNRPWLQCQAGIAWLQVVYTHAPGGPTRCH